MEIYGHHIGDWVIQFTLASACVFVVVAAVRDARRGWR